MHSNDVAQVLRLASFYASTKGLSLSTISLRIANQGSLFTRLAKGKSDLTIGRRDRILRKFSDNWPADLAWPDDIPRPAPTRKEEVAA